MLEIKKLVLNYEKNSLYSIKDVNLSEGDKLCVLGKNGIGKSTFLRALIFDKSESNKIIVNNKKLNDLSLSIRVNYFGLQTQNNIDTFWGTAKDFLELSYVKKNDNMNNSLDSLVNDFKLEKIIDSRFNILSGGQKKILSIASIFIQNPYVYLLDEPLANLDFFYQKIILDNLKKLKNKIIIMTSHDLTPVNEISSHLLLLFKNSNYMFDKTEKIFLSKNITKLYEVPFSSLSINNKNLIYANL
tara:strand:- start:316 stop:1047 length:732 start_codon:yes stop_codon:yes gene_type:complete